MPDLETFHGFHVIPCKSLDSIPVETSWHCIQGIEANADGTQMPSEVLEVMGIGHLNVPASGPRVQNETFELRNPCGAGTLAREVSSVLQASDKEWPLQRAELPYAAG